MYDYLITFYPYKHSIKRPLISGIKCKQVKGLRKIFQQMKFKFVFINLSAMISNLLLVLYINFMEFFLWKLRIWDSQRNKHCNTRKTTYFSSIKVTLRKNRILQTPIKGLEGNKAKSYYFTHLAHGSTNFQFNLNQREKIGTWGKKKLTISHTQHRVSPIPIYITTKIE